MKKIFLFSLLCLFAISADAQWSKKTNETSGEKWIESPLLDANDKDAQLVFRIYGKSGEKSFNYGIFSAEGVANINARENTVLYLKATPEWKIVAFGYRDGKNTLTEADFKKIKSGKMMKIAPVGGETYFLNLNGLESALEHLKK